MGKTCSPDEEQEQRSLMHAVPIQSSRDGHDAVPVKRRSNILALLLSVMFISSIVDSVLAKKVAISAKDYPYTISMLSPVAGFAVYSIGCCYLRVMTKRLDAVETRTIPWWKACVIGILFSLHNVLRNLGNRGILAQILSIQNCPNLSSERRCMVPLGNTVSGAVVLLVSKLNVPVSAALSVLPPLPTKLNQFQLLGIAVLILGTIVTIGPKFFDKEKPGSVGLNTTTDSASEGMDYDFAEWLVDILLLIAAVVPTSVAMLFIELQVQHVHPQLHVMYLWAKVCVAEFFLGLLFAPLNAWFQGIPLIAQLPNMWQGFLCIVLGQEEYGNECAKIPRFYLSSIIFGCAFNMAMAGSIKAGSATLMWFVRAMTLPFGGIVFSF
eukprot:SAG31_NODE_9378_length_1288_cov_1.050463_1_plen_380_part_10